MKRYTTHRCHTGISVACAPSVSMLPRRGGGTGYDADHYERENEAKLGQLHSRITNLKNVGAFPRICCSRWRVGVQLPSNVRACCTAALVLAATRCKPSCILKTAWLGGWQITIAIGDEVRDQNRALDMMGGGFGDTDNLIGSTMKKMQVPTI
jgi:hypothetical protein